MNAKKSWEKTKIKLKKKQTNMLGLNGKMMFEDVLDCGLMIPKDGILTLLKSGEKLWYLQFLGSSQNAGSKPKDIHALGEWWSFSIIESETKYVFYWGKCQRIQMKEYEGIYLVQIINTVHVSIYMYTYSTTYSTTYKYLQYIYNIYICIYIYTYI